MTKVKIKIKPVSIEEDCLVYECQLNKGVPWVSPAMYNDAEARAAEIGRRIVDYRGDFQHTRLYFDTPITEAEAELLEEL